MRVVIANKHRSMIGGRGLLQERKVKITEEHIRRAAMSGAAMFSETFRHYCGNPRCRSKLKAPVENMREAFCVRGCHTQYYRKRCIVCEQPMERKRESQQLQGPEMQEPICRPEGPFFAGALPS